MCLIIWSSVVLAIAACINHVNVQCGQDSDCDLNAGGACTAAAGTADKWCAYPDVNCPNGYRYSTLDVGDGVSGVCVPVMNAGTSGDAGLPPPLPVSCVELAVTCGASGNDNCCSSPMVPRGTYYRSYDLAGDSQSGVSSFPATVSDFRLDKYEVTVGRFRKFVDAGMGNVGKPPIAGSGEHANIPGSGWNASWNANLATDTPALIAALKCDTPMYQTWTDVPGANENQPINCLTWYEAMAFCIWDGGYLPTEAEWNYAATGGDQQRAYPWSRPAGQLTLDSMHAVYYDGSFCGPTGQPCPGVIEVGAKVLGDGRFGQADLAGNAEEPMLDVYVTPYTNPCMDCVSLKVAEDSHVVRGGSARDLSRFLRTGDREFVSPRDRFRDLGARCARVP
jgi:formylglycine-generating enzyme